MTTNDDTQEENKYLLLQIIENCVDISAQIRSLQRALANHRADFNLRLSRTEDLLGLNYFGEQYTIGSTRQ
jgi:hypothetical protein